MNKPEIVLFKAKILTNTEEIAYCDYINSIIKKICLGRGRHVPSYNFYGDVYVFKDINISLTYMDSDYGNDKYHLEIAPEVWDEIPSGIDRNIVFDEGYNLVYSFQDSPDRKVLNWHLPGSWIQFIKAETEV